MEAGARAPALAAEALGAVFDPAARTGLEFCTQLRRCPMLDDLQAIAVVDDPWGESANRAFSLGADEFSPAFAMGQLFEKLCALRDEQASGCNSVSGTIVLADSSPRAAHPRCTASTSAGYRHPVRSRCFVLGHGRLQLIVASLALPPRGAVEHMLELRRTRGGELPWLLLGSTQELRLARLELEGEPNVGYLDTGCDASQIVFLANGLLAREIAPLRRSIRLPYGTTVSWSAIRARHLASASPTTSTAAGSTCAASSRLSAGRACASSFGRHTAVGALSLMVWWSGDKASVAGVATRQGSASSMRQGWPQPTLLRSRPATPALRTAQRSASQRRPAGLHAPDRVVALGA